MLSKWTRLENELICGVDIDGVLNYYPDPWVDFLNEHLGTGFKSLQSAKRTVPYQIYKDLKFEYRECGIKSGLKVRTGAKGVLEYLKSKGYTILIITSRPFAAHKTLYKQTTDWLEKNKLPYDGLIFGADKYYQIINLAPNLAFMVEDHRYYSNMIAKWGYKVFLMSNDYNQGPIEPGVIRINGIHDIITNLGGI